MTKITEQIILDVMFEAFSLAQAGQVPKDRDEAFDWLRNQLRQCGIHVVPMGISHGILKDPVE